MVSGDGVFGRYLVLRALPSQIVNRITALIKKAPASSLAHLLCEDTARGLRPEGGPLPAHAGTLILDFCLQSCKKSIFIVCKSRVWYFVIAAHMHWDMLCRIYLALPGRVDILGISNDEDPCTHVCFVGFSDKKWHFWVRGSMYFLLKWVLPNCQIDLPTSTRAVCKNTWFAVLLPTLDIIRLCVHSFQNGRK